MCFLSLDVHEFQPREGMARFCREVFSFCGVFVNNCMFLSMDPHCARLLCVKFHLPAFRPLMFGIEILLKLASVFCRYFVEK